MAAHPVLLPLTLEDYLDLPEEDDQDREIIHGRLCVAPRPLALHQVLLAYLHRLLVTYVLRRGGHEIQVILDADLLIDELNTYVSPDLMYFPAGAVPALRHLAARDRRIHVVHARPDLVVEILSQGSEQRDLVEKRRVYQEAGIPHYWVVDPRERTFRELVLSVEGGGYGEVMHARVRVRPQLFADQRPPLTLDLGRLWSVHAG